MSFDYHFGDVAIRSEIALDGLRPLPPRKAVRHELALSYGGPAPVPDRHHYTWPGRYRLELGEHRGRWLLQSVLGGSFLIDRDVSAIHIAGGGESIDPLVNDMFVRRVLPRTMIPLGASVVHAASLAGPAGGVLLVGPSGAGKSTLSAALAHIGGWTLLGDDMSVLWLDGAPVLAPAAAGVCLWPASRDALGLPPGQCREMPGYDGKIAFRQEMGGQDGLTPLRGVLMLRRSADCAAPRLEPLARGPAMAEAVKQMVMFNPNGAAAAQRVAILGRLNEAIGAAPAWRLVYPANFSVLPDVVRAISDTMMCDWRDTSPD